MPSSRREFTPRRQYAARNSALRRMGYKSYRDYLASPHWRQVRKRYREQAELPQACICGEWETALHHMTYERVGREELTDLIPLCNRCHNLVHVLERRGELGIDLEGLLNEQRALAYRSQLEAIADRRASEDRQQLEITVQRFEQLDLPARLRVLLEMGEFTTDFNDELRFVERAVRALQRKVFPESVRQRAA